MHRLDRQLPDAMTGGMLSDAEVVGLKIEAVSSYPFNRLRGGSHELQVGLTLRYAGGPRPEAWPMCP